MIYIARGLYTHIEYIRPNTVVQWQMGSACHTQVGKADWPAVQQGPPWAVDAWGLGCLIQEVYRGAVLTRTEDLRDTSSIPKNVLPVGQTRQCPI